MSHSENQCFPSEDHKYGLIYTQCSKTKNFLCLQQSSRPVAVAFNLEEHDQVNEVHDLIAFLDQTAEDTSENSVDQHASNETGQLEADIISTTSENLPEEPTNAANTAEESLIVPILHGMPISEECSSANIRQSTRVKQPHIWMQDYVTMMPKSSQCAYSLSLLIL